MHFDTFSFSTSWNWRHGDHGRTLMEEIMELGFDIVELNYKISKETLSTILPMVEKGEIKISSVHNVFPDVKDTAYDTDSMMLGYEEPEKRNTAIALTKNTIDYAAALGAKVVVIHPGIIPMAEEQDYNEMLKDWFRKGRKGTTEYTALMEEFIEFRKKNGFRYVKLIKDRLEQLGEYVLQKNYNVVLGVENRPECHQIPDFMEMEYLLDQLKGLPVYFWYDTGHGMIMENLGLLNSRAEAYRLKDKIIGMHIHDCIGVDDHWSPFIKSSNLDVYIELIKAVPVRVLELGVKNTPEDIKKGVEVLYNKVCLERK